MIATNTLIISIVYKTLYLLIGGLMIWGGYKLFLRGFTASAGNVSASVGNNALTFANAAPGTFLFVLGAILCMVSAYRGIDLKSYNKNTLKQNPQIAQQIESVDSIKTKNINIDSVYNKAKEKLRDNRFLEAYKYLYLTKGLLYEKDKNDSLKRDIDLNIKKVELSLKNLLSNPQKLNSEETESVSINDNTEDSTKN